MNKLHRPDDKLVKGFCIPTIGLLVPHLAGLIIPKAHPWPDLIASAFFFTIIVFILWEGSHFLHQLIRSEHHRIKPPYYKTISLLLLVSFLYSGIVSWLLLHLWCLFSNQPDTRQGPLLLAVLLFALTTGFITTMYELFFLQKEKIDNETQVQQLTLSKVQSELQALKNQISPHFIFNALNTLSFLITKDPSGARLYNETLAQVYRYLLHNKERDFVLLWEEIEFIHNYFHLLKIRFEDAIDMRINIPAIEAEHLLIPPISLQILIENAIKHNNFTSEKPLLIDISITVDYLIVLNPLQQKLNPLPGGGIGLRNLGNRYRLLTRRNIILEKQAEHFIVKLPVIRF